MRGFAPLCVLVLLAACSGNDTAPTKITELRKGDASGNAASIADLVRQLCISNGDSREDFDAAIEATAWNFQRTQTADLTNPLSLDVWSSAGAQVLRGNLADGEIFVCNVAVAEGATEIRELGKALSDFGGVRQKNGAWNWSDNGFRFIMYLAKGSDPATRLQVNVEIYRLPWWRNLLG